MHHENWYANHSAVEVVEFLSDLYLCMFSNNTNGVTKHQEESFESKKIHNPLKSYEVFNAHQTCAVDNGLIPPLLETNSVRYELMITLKPKYPRKVNNDHTHKAYKINEYICISTPAVGTSWIEHGTSKANKVLK